LHYDEHRVGGKRGARSLESKWSNVKHDVAKYIGNYWQVKGLKPTGTSEEDIRCMAAKIYKKKHPKGAEFGYLHVLLIVKDYPRWAEGWGTSTTVAPSRRPRVAGADQESVIGVSEEATGFEDGGDMESNVGLQVQPTGSKAAKEAHKAAKTRDGAMYAQAVAQEVLGVAATRKAAIMAEHNLILLMSTPDEGGLPMATAREFLALRQAEELKKLKLRLAEEATQEIVREEA
jgi:hypothetical protein